MISKRQKLTFGALCLVVLAASSIGFYNIIKPIIQTEAHVDSAECQQAYSKAKMCIEMETLSPEKFKRR